MKIYYLTVLGHKSGHSVAQLILCSWFHGAKIKVLAGLHSFERFWVKSTSKLNQVIGRIQFLVDVRQKPLLPCWLGSFLISRGCLHFLAHGFLSSSSKPAVAGHVLLTLWISLTSPSASFILYFPLPPHLSDSNWRNSSAFKGSSD